MKNKILLVVIVLLLGVLVATLLIQKRNRETQKEPGSISFELDGTPQDPAKEKDKEGPSNPPVPTAKQSEKERRGEAEELNLKKFFARMDKMVKGGEAKNALQQISAAIQKGVFRNRTGEIKPFLNKLSDDCVFCPSPVVKSFIYLVEKGDSLGRICTKLKREKNVQIQPALLTRMNRIEDPDRIFPGDRIVVLEERFRIHVIQNEFLLELCLGDCIVKVYPVGIGAYGKTPEGTFLIEHKLTEPPWWRQGEAIPYGDERNILGSRWMGFKELPGVTGYGIHGTIEPETIGKAVSNGCVRLLNEDVEELFDMVPLGTEVIIKKSR